MRLGYSQGRALPNGERPEVQILDRAEIPDLTFDAGVVLLHTLYGVERNTKHAKQYSVLR